MIISVHIPRTAGSSFRAYLRGNQDINLLEDYGNPIMVPNFVRNAFALAGRLKLKLKPINGDVDCLHGHFLPTKYKSYLGKNNIRFITWLRDPADRIRSQYDYCFQSDKSIDKSPFQNKVAKENWSFEAFYTDQRMRNLYSKFLWNFPISNFNFIGIVEHYEHDFKVVCEHYFNDLQPKFTYGNRTRHAEVSPSSRDQIKKLNTVDYEIYSYGLSARDKRLNRTSVVKK